MTIRLMLGDCLDRMGEIEAESIDCVVTDPPYGIKFMGRGWDHGIPGVPYWQAALRTLKPGGYLLAFGGTRTFHRQVCAIEDAGFYIHDTIQILSWVHGQGFPKSKQSLKPSWEPVTLARKPGSMVPLQVDACRVPTDDSLGGGDESACIKVKSDGWDRPWMRDAELKSAHASRVRENVAKAETLGRWPPNTLLVHHPDCVEGGACADGCPAREMDRQSGTTNSSDRVRHNGAFKSVAKGQEYPRDSFGFGDSGGASRFFPSFHYGAKATRAERNRGLEGMEERSAVGGMKANGLCRTCGRQRVNVSGECRCPTPDFGPIDRKMANHHPCVKPLGVTSWLVRLTCPPGGTVLDPFAGSGTTGVACVAEGMSFVGIEQNPDYLTICERRIAAARAERPLLDPATP